MDEPIAIQCPYCFEHVEIWLEPDVRGQLVQDCEVCCNPWQLNVERDEDGHAFVHVDRAQ